MSVDSDGAFVDVNNSSGIPIAFMGKSRGTGGIIGVETGDGSEVTVAGMGGDGVLFVNTNVGTRVAEMISLGGNGAGFINLFTSGHSNTISLNGANGSASKSDGSTLWGILSDDRLKNIHGTYDAGINEVLKLQPIRFRYKKDNLMNVPDNGEHIGFSAQEVQKVLPEAVIENSKGFLEIKGDPILWSMLNAIKEQQTQIEQLKTENEQLKETLTAIAGRQKSIEDMLLAISATSSKEKLVKLDHVILDGVQKTIQ